MTGEGERVERRLVAPLLAEAVGTMLFFFVGAGAALSGGGLIEVALAHGLVLAVMVSALGAVSGGHFNPAVTLGIWLAGRMPLPTAALYWLAQLVGAVVAGLVLRGVFPDGGSLGTPALGAGVSPAVGIAVEALLTMVLLFAVFGTAIDPRAPRIGGLAIGFAVAADILIGGPLTGAAMNPARWFGPAVASGTFADFYVWWIGPLLGAAVASLLWRYQFLEEAEPARGPADPTAEGTVSRAG
jgi:MIP family channel proteins